jgi:hypothetical protein
MLQDPSSDKLPCISQGSRRRFGWRRVLGTTCATILGVWLGYRTTIYLTIAQLHGRRVIYDDAITRWRIRLSAKQLILNHKRAVRASHGLSDREVIGSVHIDRFNERVAAWNALSLGAIIASDSTMEEYIRRHLQSSQRWTSEGPLDNASDLPSNSDK